MKLHIAHLYPDLLNIYGDRGNIITLIHRCQSRNIEVEVDKLSSAKDMNPEEHDLYFMGGGQDKQQYTVADDMTKYKDKFTAAIENKSVFLGICGGYQLFGHYYKPFNGEELRGVSIIDAYTVAGNRRFIGNVTAQLPSPLNNQTSLVGFENHSGLTYLGKNTQPLAKIITGNGNNGEDQTEGVFQDTIIGTYLHGPLLPKNPHLADHLITLALSRKYTKPHLCELHDEFAMMAHTKALDRKYY